MTGDPDKPAPAVELRAVERSFLQGGERLVILNGVDFTLAPGEIVALVGPSGAGKSTLLQVAGLLDRPGSGEVWIAGHATRGLSDSAMSRMRRDYLGFVFQFHHLLPEFTALENVVLPQLIAGIARREARARAGELLAMMGLAERASHPPARLSGGEQQRVAIARAMANAPRVILADEPTGNLDHQTATRVMTLLIELVHRTGVAALVATHNLELAARMDRTIQLAEGQLREI
jgi:lipoprotein-releasing system ATP-binding protein